MHYFGLYFLPTSTALLSCILMREFLYYPKVFSIRSVRFVWAFEKGTRQ